jgi:beta-lactamase regulating signal transducer with metallopeptidase domain
MHLQPSHANVALLLPILADAAIKGFIILTLAAIAARVMSKGPAARRHLLWVLAFTGTLVIPILSAISPSWRIPFSSRDSDHLRSHGEDRGIASVPSLDTPLAGLNPFMVIDASTAVAHPHDRFLNAKTQRSLPTFLRDLPTATFELWLVGEAVMLVLLALGAFSMWLVGRRATRVNDPSWLALLNECRRQIGLKQEVTLLASDERAMPMTWGILFPKLLIPSDAAHWTPHRRRVVLLHELAHVQRRDCLAQLIGRVSRAIHWFNPLCWWANRQLTVERELACDDAVLNRGALASDYAEQLLAVAAACRPVDRWPAAAVAMARPSKLRERLVAILDPHRSHTMISQRERLAFVAILAALMVPMSLFKTYAADDAPPAAKPAAEAIPTPGELPPLAADAELLVRIDLAKMTRESSAAALKAILGDKAEFLTPQLVWFASLHKSLTAHHSGIYWVATSLSPRQSGAITTIGYVQIGPDTDVPGLIADFKKTSADSQAPEVSVSGMYLVIRNRANAHAYGLNPPPAAAEPAMPAADQKRLAAFSRAIRLAKESDGLVLALVATPGLTSMLEKPPTELPLPLVLMFHALAASDSAILSASIGNAPSLTLTLQTADDTKNKFVSATIDQALAEMANLLLPLKKNLEEAASPESAKEAKNLGTLLDRLHQTKTAIKDHAVELSIDNTELAVMGHAAAPLMIGARRNAQQQVSISNMKQLVFGMIIYANSHNGTWPDKLEDVTDAVGGAQGFKQLTINPANPNAPVYIYEKPEGSFTHPKAPPAETPILFELKDGKKNESGFIGYADGHVQKK